MTRDCSILPGYYRPFALFALALCCGKSNLAVGQNAVACASDRSALPPIDQQIQSIQSAVVTPQQMTAQTQLYQAAEAKRNALLAKGTTDCAAACRQDRSMQTSLNNQLETLLQREQQNSAQGINPGPIQQEIKQLRATMEAQSVQTNKDCAAFTDGAVPGSGTVLPHYQILFVVYAPPGANGGKGVSSVDYGSGSTLESTVSSSNSFATDLKISSTFTAGAFGDDASLGISFDQSVNTTNTSSVDLKETVTNDLKVPGPSTDGIDHNSDQIYLLLNPAIRVTQTKTSASWALGVNGASGRIQYLYVSWLKQPSTMPPGVLAQLQSAGIQPKDYATILSVDPFANGATAVDTSRYKQLTTIFPYEPPNSSSQTPLSDTYTIKDEEQDTNGNSLDTSTSLGVTVGVNVNAVFAKVSLSISDTFTYKYDNSYKQSTDNSSSETVTVGQPAFGYTGPTALYVYRDSLFQTYMFSLTPPPGDQLLATGTVLSSTGVPQRFADVLLIAGGHTYRTVTNANGVYRLMGQSLKRPETGTLQIGTVKLGVVLTGTSITQNVKLDEPLAPTTVRHM